MTSPLSKALIPMLLAPTASAAMIVAPSPAMAEPNGRAVALCRAEMLSQFPEGAVRSYRVADISGNSRRTRVRISLTADRRYTFECATDADGRIVTAAFEPSRGTAQPTAVGQR